MSRLASPSTISTRPAARSQRGDGASATRSLLPLARAGGALALLAMGARHLQQYLAEYSPVPTIGSLFLLNFIGAVSCGLGLLVPLPSSARLALRARAGLACVGLAMAATSVVFLLISEQTPLFGFLEEGYRTPIIVALASEGAAVLLLAGYLAGLLGRRHAPRV